MVEEPSHVKQVYLNHLRKIGLISKRLYKFAKVTTVKRGSNSSIRYERSCPPPRWRSATPGMEITKNKNP
jgi:hypothetical protein